MGGITGRRVRGLLAVAAVVGAVAACAPPAGSQPYLLDFTRVAPTSGGMFTLVDGTVTNQGTQTYDYEAELIASSGQTSAGYAFNVVPGQKAVWQSVFDGNVNVRLVRTNLTSVAVPPAVNADVVFTHVALSAGGSFTEADGLVTNTGSAMASFAIELLGSSGEVSTGYANDVQPGQQATWSAIFDGYVSVQLVRITN